MNYYRIITDGQKYKIQKWERYWPFWVVIGYNMWGVIQYDSKEEAQSHIDRWSREEQEEEERLHRKWIVVK